jgi:hypothetical protein
MISFNENPMSEAADRHAPAGFRIFMQFFAGETREQALREAAAVAGIDQSHLAGAPGYFDCGECGELEDDPVFRPDGWMVFVPEGWFRGEVR